MLTAALALTSASSAAGLSPLAFSTSSTPAASLLGSLRRPPGLKKSAQVGRGPSSGWGKTAGRGTKGQWARNSPKPGFEGGQSPAYKRTRKFGFTNAVFKRDYTEINLQTLERMAAKDWIKPGQTLTLRELANLGLFKRSAHGVKLLARGAAALTTPIHLQVQAASRAAVEAVERVGGTVTTCYATPQGVRRFVSGDMERKFAAPPRKLRSRYDSMRLYPLTSEEELLRERGLTADALATRLEKVTGAPAATSDTAAQ